jgi:hypothetical protein
LSVLWSLFVAVPAQAAPVVIINQCPSISCNRASGNFYSTPAYSLAPGSVTVRIGELASFGGSTIVNNPLKTEAGTQAESIEWRWRAQELNGTYPETYQSRINTCGNDVTGTYCSDQIHLDTITITGLNTDKMVQVQFRLIRNNEPTAWFADVASVSLRHIEARVRDFTPTASISHSDYGANPIFVLANETFSISALNSLPNDDTFDLSQSTFAWNMYHGFPFTSLTSGTGTKSHSYNTTGSYTIQLRVRNSMAVEDLETRTVYVSESPASDSPSFGLSHGQAYTSTPNETLSIVWPRYAYSMVINDGVGPLTSGSVASSPAWDFGWTATSGETRAVTVTFYDGSGAQVGSVLSQTVTYDIDAPLLNSATATRTDGALAFTLSATDQHSGVSQVEISNGATTSTYAYATSITSVLSGSNFDIRVKDLAGNWSASQSIVATTVNTAPSAPADNPPANNAPAPSGDSSGSSAPPPPAQPITPRVALKTKTPGVAIARQAGVSVTPGSKVSITVAKASKKICKVSGGRLVALKPGNCRVTVSVTPKKTKLVKKPKAVKTPTTVVVG